LLRWGCTGFQPISIALRIDCAVNFGIEMLKKTRGAGILELDDL
jgi:hypothetical protein